MAMKTNMRASAAPQVTDDETAGYGKGSLWLYAGVLWTCDDATAGAARWVPHAPEYDAWQPGTFREPANFGGEVSDVAGVADQFYLFPFLITRPIGGVGIAVTTAGSAGAQAPVGLYPNNPVTNKPDGQARIGGSLTLLTLASSGARTANFTARDVAPGLYWVGIGLKSVTTMPVVKQMSRTNGRHVNRGDINDIVSGSPYKFLQAAVTIDVSAPSVCPGTTPGNGPAPMPMLQAA